MSRNDSSLDQRVYLADLYGKLGKSLPDGWRNFSSGLTSALISKAKKELDRRSEETLDR